MKHKVKTIAQIRQGVKNASFLDKRIGIDSCGTWLIFPDSPVDIYIEFSPEDFKETIEEHGLNLMEEDVVREIEGSPVDMDQRPVEVPVLEAMENDYCLTEAIEHGMPFEIGTYYFDSKFDRAVRWFCSILPSPLKKGGCYV